MITPQRKGPRMSRHNFAKRLFFLRDTLEQVSRIVLSQRLQAWALRHPNDPASAELKKVSWQDIKQWETGIKEPSQTVKRRVAQVLGYRYELLDPNNHGDELEPEGLLRLARDRRLPPLALSHAWKVISGQRIFKGNPTPQEWERILQSFSPELLNSYQPRLFDFFCTNCGFSDIGDLTKCPNCGELG